MAETTQVPLSPLDNALTPVFATGSFLIPLEPDETPDSVYEILNNGLNKTVQIFPILEGKVYWLDAQGRLEVRIPSPPKGKARPPLKRADKTNMLPSCEELVELGAPQHYLGDLEILLPECSSAFPDLENGGDILVAQANFIEGGVVLTVGTNHSVLDGAGWNIVMKTWASCCRGEDKALSSSVEDRDIVRRVCKAQGLTTNGSTAQAWQALCLTRTTGSPMSIPNAPPPTEMAIFYVPSNALSELRREAGSDKRISTTDALIALIWRAVTRARFPPGSPRSHTETVLDTTLDGRTRYSEQLTGDYLGNLVFWVSMTMDIDELTAEDTPLSSIAQLSREKTNGMTTKKMHEAVALAASIQNYKELSRPFLSFGGNRMVCSSLMNLNFCELDFGRAGSVESFRFGDMFSSICRACEILPRTKSGGVEVFLCMLKEEMDRLKEDKEFNEYACFLCH